MPPFSGETDAVSKKESDARTYAVLLNPLGIDGLWFSFDVVEKIFLGRSDSMLSWLHDHKHLVQHPDGTVQLVLRARQIYQDQGGPGHILVMCDAYDSVGEPMPSNRRHAAAETLNHPDVVSEKLWFQMDQYCMFLRGGCTGHQEPRPWEFKNALPDKAKVDSAIQEISQRCALAGIQCGSPSTIFLADRNMWIARFMVQSGFAYTTSTIPDEVSATHHNKQDGTFLGDNVCTVRHLGTTSAKKHELVVVDPTMIPGFLPGTMRCIMFSTQSMRNGSTGYEACIVAVDKLEMWNILSGECNIEVKILPCYNARIEGDYGKRKPSGYVIEVKMPPSHDMDPYIISSRIAEAVLLWKPTVHEILAAKSRTNPFLRAVRSTWNKLKRFWTCSCSASA